MSFWVMAKNIYKLQMNFNVRHQRKVWKGLYHQICPMSHKMHTHDEWNISTLDLNYNSRFEALESIDPMNTTIDRLWSKLLFLQTPLCH